MRKIYSRFLLLILKCLFYNYWFLKCFVKDEYWVLSVLFLFLASNNSIMFGKLHFSVSLSKIVLKCLFKFSSFSNWTRLKSNVLIASMSSVFTWKKRSRSIFLNEFFFWKLDDFCVNAEDSAKYSSWSSMSCNEFSFFKKIFIKTYIWFRKVIGGTTFWGSVCLFCWLFELVPNCDQIRLKIWSCL